MLADPLSAFEKFQARDCKNSKVKWKESVKGMWPWARAALPQFWELQLAWSPVGTGQAESSAAPAALGARKTQVLAVLGALVPLPGCPLQG